MPFPYPLPDLDLAAPFDRHRARVLPEWIDPNGHMNLGYYLIAFDHATDVFCTQLGVSWPYVEHRLGMVFVLETHLTYEREVGENAPLRFTTQILDHDAKRLHLIHAMYHGEDGWLASTNELMMLHVDYADRRSAPWPEEVRQRIERMAAVHAALARPPQAGRRIGIPARRSPAAG